VVTRLVIRRSIPAILVVLAATALGVGLQFTQRFTGTLELHRRYGNYGGATFATGARQYPRTIDDSEGYALKMSRPTRTIASQFWSIDDYVYAITPPQSVVAVSEYAFQRSYSNVFQWADLFHPVVASDPEVILKLNPDLLLVSSDARADFTHLLRTAETPVFRMYTSFTKVTEIPPSIRLVGYLTGRDVEGERLAADFEQAIRRAQSRKPTSMPPPRVLGFAGTYSYGDQTMFDDIVRTLGGVNVGAENGLHGYSMLNSEQILAWNPEWILAGANRGETQRVLRKLLDDPAISLTAAAQNGHVVVLENNVFMPISPYTTLVLDAIGNALYGPSSEVKP
jgi:iron complex transport system substrate-binding protein